MTTIYREIVDERQRQDAKWGQQNHNAGVWLAILMEEVGEAASAALSGNSTLFRAELIQVAAVAVATVESLDRQGGQIS